MTVVELPGVAVEDAFLAAYRGAHAATVRLAYVLCGDAGRAEELAHDAWVAAYRRHQRQPIDDVEPYVRRAVVNAVRSRGRRRVVEGRFLRRAGSAAAAGVAERDWGPVEGVDGGGGGGSGGGLGGRPGGVERVEDRAELVSLLQQLPERMLTCVALRFAADLTVAETAEVMGISEGTVKSTTSKALARLRELRGEDDG